MTSRRPTRTDVARLAGTSVAVISYVINDGPRGVAPETRERVVRAMNELGYQPNALARSLSAKSTNTIGMIVPTLRNVWVSELAASVEDVFVGSGRMLFLGSSDFAAERELAYVRGFVQQRVAGIVVLGSVDDASVALAREAEIPILAIHEPSSRPGVRTVPFDNEPAAAGATSHLLDHGYEQVACLTGSIEPSYSDEHVRGWATAREARGLEPSPELILRAPYTLEGGAVAVLEFWERTGSLPRALYCASDELARGALAQISAMGGTVPDDVAIVSVGGTRAGTFSTPSISTYAWSFTALAASIAAELFAEGPAGVGDLGARIVAELRLGESCGPHSSL